MTSHSKLVAVALVVVMLAMPAASLSFCRPEVTGTGGHDPDSPMTGMRASSVLVHWAEKHVMGTVTSISDNSITVETKSA